MLSTRSRAKMVSCVLSLFGQRTRKKERSQSRAFACSRLKRTFSTSSLPRRLCSRRRRLGRQCNKSALCADHLSLQQAKSRSFVSNFGGYLCKNPCTSTSCVTRHFWPAGRKCFRPATGQTMDPLYCSHLCTYFLTFLLFMAGLRPVISLFIVGVVNVDMIRTLRWRIHAD